MLQGKGEAAGRDFVRFNINTLFGVFGLFDSASEAGIDHQYEDFGQTLGRWGVPAGAYIVLPLLGPVDGARHGGAAARPRGIAGDC